ncbi:proteasome maturation protein-like [Uloborus diversus]|uniref:proteasome maturation protein-like n=1 Tax=Uloborus diversus TaxID=327109 RepID=UPI00240A0927|nr:proteasome maturation protein-like [Uloborus diversus]XP_054724105.1 proteasome maturation protein-like [Uloborus diversus]
MDLPSLKTQPQAVEKVQMKESGDYSSYDMMTNGFMSVRSQLCVQHPIEYSEKNFVENREKMKLSFLRSSQGLHAPLRILHEKNAVRKVQRLPFLPSSNIALETLEGRDEFIDFGDNIFNDPEEGVESIASPFMVMEKCLFSSNKC